MYNENRRRVQKRVDGVATNYYLHGKNVVHMTRGSDELHFFYDAQNKPAVVVYNGTAYAYLKNLQGDIVAILNGSGSAVVSYVYDAWGRPVSKTGSMASTLGTVQPFRYRSYVYDEETGLYYLRSRYYRPEQCRFLNADAILAQRNSFGYCSNKPIALYDPNGTEDRHSDSYGDITNFIREGFGAISYPYYSFDPVRREKREHTVCIMYIPYQDIQYYNNSVLFEAENPMSRVVSSVVEEAASSGTDAIAEGLDKLAGVGRYFSYTLALLGIATEYANDVAEAAALAEHKAAAQAAIDNQSGMIVVIDNFDSWKWCYDPFHPRGGYYLGPVNRSQVSYYESNQFWDN